MTGFLSKFGHDLLQNGYPIVPIKPGLKHPGEPNWQTMQVDKNRLDRMLANGHAKSGAGILTGDIIAVDLDIRDVAVRDTVLVWCQTHFGNASQRTGEAPKTLLVFRSETPLTKRTTPRFEDFLGNIHQIEILGKGQQFVAYAVHPDTKEPYIWDHRPLAEMPVEDLPTITSNRIDALFRFFEQVVPEDWAMVSQGSAETVKPASGNMLENAEPPLSLSQDEIEAALKITGGRCENYEDWIKVGMALHHQFGGSSEGFALWDNWSQNSTKYRSAEMLAKWRSLKPDYQSRPVTFATVLHMAKQDAPTDNTAGEEQHSKLSPTRWDWVDPAAIPPRDWLYGYHLIRKYVSVTIAPGGVGKSRLLAAEALAMVTGHNLLGRNTKKLRVWLWNLEDGLDELNRCIAAACKHYGISATDIGDRLCVDSGRQQELCTAKTGRNGVEILEPVYQGVTDALRTNKIDVLIVDPFVSSHGVPENDNGMIDAVIKRWARVADDANCAIELVHHTRKENGGEITADSSRGGSAIASAARDVRVLNRMTSIEAEKFGVDNHRQYFRLQSDKANLAPIEDADWFHIESVDLLNAPEELGGDSVGVISKWEPPDAFADITDDMTQAALERIAKGDCRSHDQASEWAGHAIGTVLGIDSYSKAGKRKLKNILS
ncbi:MAG: AAA family ATPase [Robiginitomaculum sp.]